MALVDSQEVTLAISAQTSGQAGVTALADQVDALSRSGSAAAPEIARITQEIQRLGQQQVSINGLEQAIAAGKETWQTLSQARHEVQVLDKALADARGAGASAEAIRILDKELRTANAQLVSAEKAWTRQKSVLAAARAEAAGMGIDTRNVGAAQQKLAADIEAANRRVQAASVNAGASLKNAFETVGVRSAQVIQQEILDVERALQRIAAEGQVTGREFDRVWAAGQERIGRLNGELNGSSAALDKVGTSTNVVSAGLTRLAAAFGGVQAARAFLDANVELEQLRRGLTAVTGDAGLAEAELDRLRGVADTLGVSVGTLGKSWISLAAATRGSSLEGQATREVFDAVAATMAKLGKSTADTEGALYAVGQMASKGVVSMEELRQQLGERMPGALDAMAKGLGISNEALIELVSSGQLLAEDALPALAKGLQQTFGSSQQLVDGFTASLQRLKNTSSETAQTLGDVGIMDALATAADWAAAAIKRLSAEFVLVGKQLGITAGAIAEFDLSSPIQSIRNWWSALGEANAEVTAKLYGVGTAAKKAASETQSAAAAGQQAGTQFAAAAPAIDAAAGALNNTAASAKAAATATAAAGQTAQQSGAAGEAAAGGWVALSVAYTQAMQGAANHTAQMVKLAEAVKAEGEAAVTAAELTGNEVTVLEARAAAADKNAVAAQNIAVARNAELATLQSQLAALQEEGARTGQLTEAKQNQLTALQKLIEQKGVEVQKSQEVAKTLAAEAKAAQEAATGIEAAFKRLGVTSTAKLKELADNAQTDFERIRESGNATSADLQRAWMAYAEKAIAANGGVASASLKAEAAIYKVRVETDETGKAIVRAMAAGESALDALGNKAEEAAAKVGLIKREYQGLEGVWDADGNLIDKGSTRSNGTRSDNTGGGIQVRGSWSDWDDNALHLAATGNMGKHLIAGAKEEQARRKRGGGSLQGAPAGGYEPAVAKPTAPERQVVHRVDISLGGQTRSIATDAAGASTLTALLRELETDAQRA